MNNIMGPLDYFRARVLGSDHDPLGVQPFTTYEDGSTDNPAPPPPPAETARMTFMPMLHPDQRPVG